MNPGGIFYGYYGIKFDSDCVGGKEVHFLYKGIIYRCAAGIGRFFNCQKCHWVINKKKNVHFNISMGDNFKALIYQVYITTSTCNFFIVKTNS